MLVRVCWVSEAPVVVSSLDIIEKLLPTELYFG